MLEPMNVWYIYRRANATSSGYRHLPLKGKALLVTSIFLIQEPLAATPHLHSQLFTLNSLIFLENLSS
ncbi:MAG: hypothetical protein ACI4RP_01970 [Acutalibacteraceae bacterium]